jgi:beta-glucosidase
MTRRILALSGLIIVAAAAAVSTQAPATSRPPALSSFDPEVNALLARMTLDEKVGQMTQPDQDFMADPTDIETYFLGSVLSGGDSDPKTNTVEDWADMYDRYQSHALETRLKIPLLYGVDAVHGHNNVIGAVVFPHNIGLGATRNAKLVEEIGRLTAKEVRTTGVNWAFAPCVAVVRDERWGRTYESFAEEPGLVAELGAAATRGLQAGGLGNPLAVLACAKHYVGDGGTSYKTGTFGDPAHRAPLDQGDTRLTEAELKQLHMQGYVTSIREGVGSIMPSYSSWNGEKVSGSRHLLTEVLKGELGFEGFLISDYNALDQLPGDQRSQIKLSINAGMDMVMVPQRYKEFFTTLKDLVQKGEVPVSRIDDAVRRILRVKYAMGLMKPGAKVLTDRSLMESFGSAAHRAVARQAVRESLVLLKNQNGRLPLARTLARIHVAGRNANDIGNQTGGWTITWQGQSGPITPGTTILMGLRQLAGKKTKVSYSEDGSGAAGADVGVVVVGETPYAEGFGDRTDLALSGDDVKAIRAVKAAGVPVVVVLVSGRPLVISEALDAADAVVAAWLPGTEGTGVADVLYGDYAPTGKLSFSWPRSTAQLPINVGDTTYDPLFPFGYGLTYSK